MERDLGEVIASQRTMIERLGKTSARQSDEQLAENFGKQLRMGAEVLAAGVSGDLYRHQR